MGIESLSSHIGLVVMAGALSLLGTWVGMRHFARARATEGAMRRAWLCTAAIGTGVALWASALISIEALAPSLRGGFAPVGIVAALLVAILSCLVGFELGRRHFPFAPEAGGLVMGIGIVDVHFLGLGAWEVAGTITWNRAGIAVTLLLGLALGVLAVNRANRPVTRWCRHGAAMSLALLVCVLHVALAASATLEPDPAVVLRSDLIPSGVLGFAAAAAVLMVMGSGFSAYLIDLRARTDSADRIHQLSFNDAMTGLPNRVAFNERLAFDAAAAHDQARKLAVLAIDLDGFKEINEVFGHAAGDLLLIRAADRMRRVLQTGEFLARQSGDEFLGLQLAGDHPRAAQSFAERLADVFATPFEIGDQPVRLTASIGYSIFPTDTPERDHALSNAKLAMSRGKSRQRGAISQYRPDMDDQARARRVLARDLQGAADRGELLLHYQLQASLDDGAIRGAEALMRWQHPRRGLISPAEFIPLAEDTGAIIAMGEWALRTACRDAAEGRIPGTVAVNLSPVQFGRETLAETIHQILLETRLSPRRLEVEVTESTVMSDRTQALRTLRRLKAMGISVAMDDFGTGHSSLSTLHAFPFDKIKLDQSFVKRLPHDAGAAAIVRTVLALGRSLGRPVLAEGIETEAQWRFLSDAGCDMGQGYLLARPVAIEQVGAAIAAAATRMASHDDEPVAAPRIANVG
jgi:diguanylate cyclase (GGDEF)-like protein